MLNRENSPADLAIRSLRTKVLFDEVPKTEIAKSTGMGRTTIAKRLKSKDMSVNEYVAITKYLGIDPIKLLETSIQKSESAAVKSPNSPTALYGDENQGDIYALK